MAVNYMKREINEWLKKADGDLLAAKKLLENKMLPWIIAFHCQQSVEKYLKALQIKFLNDYDKNHDLVKLAKSIEKSIDLSSITDDLMRLTGFYITERYPNGEITDISLQDAKKAVEITERVVNKLAKYL